MYSLVLFYYWTSIRFVQSAFEQIWAFCSKSALDLFKRTFEQIWAFCPKAHFWTNVRFIQCCFLLLNKCRFVQKCFWTNQRNMSVLFKSIFWINLWFVQNCFWTNIRDLFNSAFEQIWAFCSKVLLKFYIQHYPFLCQFQKWKFWPLLLPRSWTFAYYISSKVELQPLFLLHLSGRWI